MVRLDLMIKSSYLFVVQPIVDGILCRKIQEVLTVTAGSFCEYTKSPICLHKYTCDNLGELSIDRYCPLVYHFIMKNLSVHYILGGKL